MCSKCKELQQKLEREHEEKQAANCVVSCLVYVLRVVSL